MCHATRPLPPVHIAVSPALWAPDPRAELRLFQNGECAACRRPLASRHYFLRDRGGLRVAALICMACAQARVILPDPPVLHVPPLLRLRLTHGTPASTPRGDAHLLSTAAANGEWDRFASPLHALLVHQGGRCALHHPDKPHRERCSTGEERQLLYVDHDHQTGLARALLCPPCNSREGWRSGSSLQLSLAKRLREQPPAQSCEATAGLTHYWLTGWPRPAWWPSTSAERRPSRTRPRPSACRARPGAGAESP